MTEVRFSSLFMSFIPLHVLSCHQVDEEEVFPLNMSDFVTVDEVGDVTELPSSPSPTVPMETTEGGEDGPTSVQLDTAGVHSDHLSH